MKKLENLFQRKNLLFTLGIIVLIAAATLVAVFRINIAELLYYFISDRRAA